jgi:hypothetical protein
MIGKSSRNQDEVGQILDTCLELISSGSRTVDSVIEQYPEYADDLRPPLEAAQWLRSRSEVFNPRPGFVNLSKRRLVGRFKSNNSNSTATVIDSIRRIPAFIQSHRVAVQYSALLTITAVLLFVGYQSTSFLVQRSIPGDPLYKTKLAQENIRLSLSSNQEQDVLLRIEFAQRRVVEMQELILAERHSLLDETLKNFEFQISEAARGIVAISETDRAKAAEMSALFDETLTMSVNNLVGIVDASPEHVSTDFVQTLNVLAAEVFDLPPFTPYVVVTTVTPTADFTSTFTPSPGEDVFFSPGVFASPTATAPLAGDFLPSAQPSDTPFTKILPTGTPTPTDTPTAPPAIKVKPTDIPTPTPSPTPDDDPDKKPRKPKKPRPTQRPTKTHQPPGQNKN